MNFSIINKLNFTRLAGLKYFIIIEIYPYFFRLILVKRKESILKINNGDVLQRIEVLTQINIEHKDDFDLISQTIPRLLREYNLAEISVLVGITDYKLFNLSIPAEVEDDEIWFIENSVKFLPEGRAKEEFNYSYECYNKDENYKYYQLAIARKSLVEKIENLITITGNNIISIAPFLTLIQFPSAKDPAINIFISVSPDRISYLFQNFSGIRETGFIFYPNFEIEKIKDKIIEIHQNFMVFVKNNNEEEKRIFLSCDSKFFEQLKSELEEQFKTKNINTDIGKHKPENTASLLAINHKFYENDKINLINKDKIKEISYKIEKQFSLRIILAFGSIIIFLLLIAYAGENYFITKSEKESQNIQEVTSLKNQIQSVKKENQNLSANYQLLQKLRGKRERYSLLLYEISNLVHQNSYLTGLDITKENSSTITTVMAGFASSQKEVADLIRRIEQNAHFDSIVLLNSTSHNPTGGKSNKLIQKGNAIEFRISLKYNAD